MSRQRPVNRSIVWKVIAVLAGLVLALGPVTPAAAGTGTNGPLTIIATDQVLQPGCYTYPNLTYTVTHPTHWSLQVTVSRPGAVGDSDFASGDGPTSGALGAFLCESVDGPGTYTVHAVLTPYDSAYNRLPDVAADTTFVLSLPPAVATTMTISASPRTAGYREAVDVSGQILYTDPASGTRYAADGLQVTLAQRYLGTSTWTNVATGLTAGLQPTFDFTRIAVRNTEYRVTFGGNEKYLASVSLVTVRVHRQVTGRIAEPREHVFFMVGKVRPAYAGQRVYLMRQRCPSCAYRTYATQRTSPASRYRFSLPRPSSGSYHFKVRVPASTQFLVSYSSEWRLTRIL